ncbi:MAG: glycosyltransferase family 39 protein [Candidatus Hydrogenedentes bacterium]|nr:glycosyltransferase family 39 protein [Candidatus Hydrogenedentota bacterium]
MLDRQTPSAFKDSSGEKDSGALRMLWEYTLWTAVFLAGVGVFHVLRLQAIAGHATPFYAYLKPLHNAWTAWIAVAPLITIPVLLMRRVLCGQWNLNKAWIAALVLSALAPALFVAEVYLAGTGGDERSWVRATPIAASVMLHDAIPLLIAEAALVAALLSFRRLRVGDAKPTPLFLCVALAGAMVFLFVFSGAVAELRGGLYGITKAYLRLDQEYISDIGEGDSLRGFIGHFTNLHPSLSHHGRVHPPGPTVLLWLLSFAVGLDAQSLSLATMACATLLFVPCYLWAREIGGPRMGLVACALFTVSPGIVAFTATSADMLFMPFTLTTLFLFERAVRKRSWPAAIGAGVFYALISFCSFNLLCVGAYFGLVGLNELRDPDRRLAIVRTAALMFAGFLAVFGLLYVWSGFNMVECFLVSWREQRFDLAAQTDRWPAPYWRVLHPVSVLYYTGIPIAVLFFRRLLKPDALQHETFVCMALALLFLSLIVPARGEMERTGLYMYPLLIAPAAHLLTVRWQQSKSEAVLASALGFLAFQVWLTEYLFQGYW